MGEEREVGARSGRESGTRSERERREEKRRERGREERGHKILAELTRLADFLKRSYNYTGYEIHAVFSIYSMKNIDFNLHYTVLYCTTVYVF